MDSRNRWPSGSGFFRFENVPDVHRTAAGVSASLLLMAEQYSIVWTRHLLLAVHRPVGIGPFPSLAVVPEQLTNNPLVRGTVKPHVYILRLICELTPWRETLSFPKHFLYLSKGGADLQTQAPSSKPRFPEARRRELVPGGPAVAQCPHGGGGELQGARGQAGPLAGTKILATLSLPQRPSSPVSASGKWEGDVHILGLLERQ